ncbi:Rib/alpha-like domain-containing protein, partial [Lactobacillus taiwanensis]|uniref:Rib/alpha-like domain-containing protein n=1 Tax=Lactobacillus taiwanensis TaxID=508451 RepID=UPI00272FDE57
TINVTNPATDADKYTPEGQDVNTKTGVVPNPAEGIKNKSDLPDGTKYTWKEVPNVNTLGEHTGVITVTYPDGSSVNLTVKVYVDAVAKENNSNNTAQVITKHVAETNEKKTSATPAQQINHSEKATLPQTGAKSENAAGILGLAIAAVGSLFGLAADKKRRDK